MSVPYLILYNKSREPTHVIHYHYHLNCMDIVIDTVTLRKEQRDENNKKFVENKYANRK